MSNRNQNHKMTKTFSDTAFKAMTHLVFFICFPPALPKDPKSQDVVRGKTMDNITFGSCKSNLNVKDRHVITLVNRCKKITDLNLMVTSISNNSVTTIIGTQSENLEKLGVSNIDFKKLLELRSMLKLKVLNFDNIVTLDELTILKNQLPHLNINEDGPKAMKLRIPYPVGDLRLLKILY